MMQEHRRALARRGGSRQADPVIRAARTVYQEMQPSLRPLFGELVDSVEICEIVDPVIPQEAISDQQALFGVVIRDTTGATLNLSHPDRLRLAARLRSLGMTGPIPLPTQPERCARLLYESIKEEQRAHDIAVARAAAYLVGEDMAERLASLIRHRWISDSLAAIQTAVHDGATDSASQSVGSADADDRKPSLFDTTGLMPQLLRH